MIEKNCNLNLLHRALSHEPDALDAAQLQQLELHLSDCTDCRQQLEAIAGQPQFWTTAAESLAGTTDKTNQFDSTASASVLMRVDPNATGPSCEWVSGAQEELVADPWNSYGLLDPPAHPEMLGRIDGFSVEQIIGRGGMGIVFKGFDAELNRPVAIKFLAPHLAANGVARQRFAREAQAAAAVVHPNVVPIHSVNSSPVRPYIVMALMSGRSLQKHVDQHGPLAVKDVVRIGQQIAAGLAAAHEQGLVHRDIKPANILLEHDVSRVMITDFGLARAADDAALTQTGWLAGTPHYMSPEQAGGEEIDHRSDLFSLGSVMYFMATGREPFRAEKSLAVLRKIAGDSPASTRSINNSVPRTLELIVEKLLAKDANKRFESAHEIQDMLTRYLAYLQNPKNHRKPVVSNLNRNWTRLILGWTAVLLVSIATALWATQTVLDARSESKAISPQSSQLGETGSMQAVISPSKVDSNVAGQHFFEPQYQALQTDSFAAEMEDLRRGIEQMEIRLGK